MNRCLGSGKDGEHLKFGRITVIAARHTEGSENELRKERDIKTHEEDYRCDSSEELGVKSARDLGPPEMESSEIAHYRSTHHDVVEMGDDKICVVDVHIHSQAGENKPSETTNREHTDSPQLIEHWSVKRDGALVEAGGPVEDLDCRRNGNKVAEKRERQRRISGLTAHKHVVPPDDKA